MNQKKAEENFQGQQSDFLVEKIKQRPVDKKKLMQRMGITVLMAVIFGCVACVTFVWLQRLFAQQRYPEWEEEVTLIEFPEDEEEEEITPAQMLSEIIAQEKEYLQDSADEDEELFITGQETTVTVAIEEEQIQEILDSVTLNLTNYRELYAALQTYISGVSRSVVTVTGIFADTDWLESVQESYVETTGVLIASADQQYYILTSYAPLADAQSIRVTFYVNNETAHAALKAYDEATGLAILTVDERDLSQEILGDGGFIIASLGNSKRSDTVGTPVVAVGSPLGSALSNSIGFGLICANSAKKTTVDANYTLLQTDIACGEDGAGILFNLQGQLIGFITDAGEQGVSGTITAYGISDLKKLLSQLVNNLPVAYAGITGLDVSELIHDSLGVPYGAYVEEIDMDSPAMAAGIQEGDVIVQIGEKTISSFSDYTSVLQNASSGATLEVTIMRQSQGEYKEMQMEMTIGVK